MRIKVIDEAKHVEQISELVRTQDNRATSDPIFIVQQKRRIWGMDGHYSDDYEWIDGDRVYYVDMWEFVTACFTEQGCKDYIAANGHNLNEPRIYAASAYRNREMIAIRKLLVRGWGRGTGE